MYQIKPSQLPRLAEFVERDRNIAQLSEVEDLSPQKFYNLVKEEKGVRLAALNWAYYLSILVYYRNKIPHQSITFAQHVNRAAELFELAEHSPHPEGARLLIRAAIPEIKEAYKDLKKDVQELIA